MITKTLIFGKGGDGAAEPQELTLEQAQAVLAVCLRLEAYIWIKPGEITVENHTLGCYTDFRGPEDEIANLAAGLSQSLPPDRARSYWLDHLREEIQEQAGK
jgi:hypothetical protein